MQVLRPYQLRAADVLLPTAFRRVTAPVRRVLGASPCGSGKTTILTYLCQKTAAKGNRAMVVAPRRKLVRQIAERLSEFGVPYGVLMADLPLGSEPWAVLDPAAPVQVASRDTLFARGDRDGIPQTDLMVFDEAHLLHDRFHAVERASGCRAVVGLTATPCKPDGSGLSAAYWHELVPFVSIEELLGMDPPCLVPVDVYAPTGVARRRRKGLKVKCSGDPIRQWFDHAEGLRTVAFCRTVAESKALRDAYDAAGVRAAHIDSDTPDADREDVLAALAAGEILVVTNVDIVGLGVDVPPVECVQLLTKCVSPIRLWQCAGRCQRTHPGKARGVLLDHAAATAEHGLPNVSPVWTLDETDSVQNRAQERFKADPGSRPATCRACGMVSAGTGVCPGCGAGLFASKSDPARTEREPLSLFTGDALPPPPKKDPRQKFWEGLLYAAAAKGHPCSQAAARFKAKFGVWPEAAGVTPVAARGRHAELVADEFPHFNRRRKEA